MQILIATSQWSRLKFLVSEALLLDILMLPRVRVILWLGRATWGKIPQSSQITWHNSVLASNRQNHDLELSSPTQGEQCELQQQQQLMMWARPLVLAWPCAETIFSFL